MAKLIGLNQAKRLLLLERDDGEVITVPIADLHDDDGDKVDSWEDCTFVTAQLPDGSWTYATVAEFSERPQ